MLAIVVAAMFAFFNKHPNCRVYATGSTLARTRLYRMGISRFYHEIADNYDLYGQVGNSFKVFETGKYYLGF